MIGGLILAVEVDELFNRKPLLRQAVLKRNQASVELSAA